MEWWEKALAHRKLREREGLEGGGLLGWKVGRDTLDSEAHANRLPFLMWNVNGTGGASVIADGALAGIMAPPLLEHQVHTFASTRSCFQIFISYMAS